MSEIHPIIPDPPSLHISRFKLAVSAVIVLGIVIFGSVSQMRRAPSTDTNGTRVLGTGTQTAESYLPDGVRDTVASLSSKQSQVRPETLFLTGKELIASGAQRLASAAGTQIERASSDAAHNVTDFIYKNTIERVIETLIHSLPPDRQRQYTPN